MHESINQNVEQQLHLDGVSFQMFFCFVLSLTLLMYVLCMRNIYINWKCILFIVLFQTTFGGQLGPNGEVWTTYSDIGTWRFGIIFATDMHNTYNLGVTAAHFGKEVSV